VSDRWLDWMHQADADLEHARVALDSRHYEWACFAAQQGAEKAVKAVHLARGEEAWGHSVTELLEALAGSVAEIDQSLLDRARSLDKVYVTARYPNGLPAGAPTDFFTRSEAERSIADAEAVLAICRRALPR
jgi:HEPN domain-containing protein